MKCLIAGSMALIGAMTSTSAAQSYGRGYAIFPCETYVVAYRSPSPCYGPRYARCDTNPYFCAPRYREAYCPVYTPIYVAPRYYDYRTSIHTVYGAPSSSGPPLAYDSIVGGSSAERTETEAWTLLGEGDAREAIGTFTKAATQRPNEAGPKIGYALSALELGDVTTGVWAMRRAFRYDAPGARYLPLDDQLVRLIDNHRQDFEYHSALDPEDRWFMVAALRYIAHQDDDARDAVALARQRGDRSYELRRLQHELDRDPETEMSAK